MKNINTWVFHVIRCLNSFFYSLWTHFQEILLPLLMHVIHWLETLVLNIYFRFLCSCLFSTVVQFSTFTFSKHFSWNISENLSTCMESIVWKALLIFPLSLSKIQKEKRKPLLLHVIHCLESLVLNFASARSQNTARWCPPPLVLHKNLTFRVFD